LLADLRPLALRNPPGGCCYIKLDKAWQSFRNPHARATPTWVASCDRKRHYPIAPAGSVDPSRQLNPFFMTVVRRKPAVAGDAAFCKLNGGEGASRCAGTVRRIGT